MDRTSAMRRDGRRRTMDVARRWSASRRSALSLGLASGLGLAAAAATAAFGHSWYPRSCCNDLDCAPVDRIERLAGGGMRLTVGHFTVDVPAGFPAMPSMDGRAHVCTYRDLAGRYLPRCLFLPGTS